MNPKSLLLEAICRNGLCHLSARYASNASALTVLPVRIVGGAFHGGSRRSSSTSVLRQSPSESGTPQRIQCFTGISCSRRYFQIKSNYPEVWGQFVRTTNTQASPAADISEGEKPKANINKAQVSFDELKALISNKEATLVDVREPEELQSTGGLPGCLNIPLTKLKAALGLSDEEFKQTYNKSKLLKDDPNVIFYGLSSVKSSAAVEIAHKMGFKKSRHYPGGMDEWKQKHPKT